MYFNKSIFQIKLIIIFFSLLYTSVSFAKDSENFINGLIQKMTLEEKVGQMNQYSSFFDVTGPPPNDDNAKHKYDQIRSGLVGSILNVTGVKEVRAMQELAVNNSRLGIPLIFGFDVIHGYKTITPIPLAESASWDLKAIELSARFAATEASAAGLNWTFAPMVDISRDARWGRVMEGAGEDPYLGSQVAIARVKGFQGTDLSATNTIAACAKHFAAYGFAEAGRDYNTADIGTSTLHNIILPPFKAAAKAGVKTFMNSFNELNGIPATGDPYLLRELLKGAWGFSGFVVSDWGSIDQMIPHGFAEDGAHAAKIAIHSGSDMDMESYHYVKHLANLVNDGKVDIQLIDDAVKRILTVKYELGLFDDPYHYCNEEREKELTFQEDCTAAALDLAKKSIVLLKNDNNTLPLAKKNLHIALIGPLANEKNSPLGSWRGAVKANTAVSVLEGMEEYKGNKVNYSKGVDLTVGETSFIREININETVRTGMDDAVEIAKKCGVVVLVLGEHGFQTAEGRSRTVLDLPGLQQELMEKIYAVNKNIVLVLMNGRPLFIPWADEHIPAIVEAWHLGSQSGNAIASVLYGDYNPSGKLTMSFPRNEGQIPIYYNHKNTGRPDPSDMVFWSHYSDESNDPLYPFGYGLSYTSFTYSNLDVQSSNEINQVTVRVTVTNTGDKIGEEVVQLYIRDLFASVTRPVKELKGFEKVALEPGQQKDVTFVLREADFSFYDNRGRFVFEPGEFDVMVGGSSKEWLKYSFEF